MNLAKETDTPLCTIEDSTRVYDERGQPVDEDKASQASDLVWAIISQAFKYSNGNCSNISPSLSLKDFFTKKLEEESMGLEDRTLVMQMAEMWGAFTGDPWERQSLKYFWLEECLDGGKSSCILLNIEVFWEGPRRDRTMAIVLRTLFTNTAISSLFIGFIFNHQTLTYIRKSLCGQYPQSNPRSRCEERN